MNRMLHCSTSTKQRATKNDYRHRDLVFKNYPLLVNNKENKETKKQRGSTKFIPVHDYHSLALQPTSTTSI
uniref:Uncharacterized protein n=1 Tax=Physcomitrium patens TaxID=3218 RepID=A0A2K1JFX1_PHYPA|nr:hypothetical protein PHYPA_017837 [Physcomitrium patens]